MNLKISQKADHAVQLGNGGGYETRPGYCGRFVRQVLQSTYPETFDASLFCGTAVETAEELVKHGHAQVFDERTMKLEEGDVIYKTYQPFGHAAIVTVHNGALVIAENSSTHLGRVNGALGYRTLNEWGAPDVIWRIPQDLGGRKVTL